MADVKIPDLPTASSNSVSNYAIIDSGAATSKITVANFFAGLADIYSVDWTNWSSSASPVGWAATPTTVVWYKVIGTLVFMQVSITGTSNATNAYITLPTTPKATAWASFYQPIRFTDNGTASTTPGMAYCNYLTPPYCFFYTNWNLGVWTNSGTKTVLASFYYITD